MGEVGMTGIGPVEADNIEVAIFDPDSSGKRSFSRFFPRLHIDHNAARFAKKLASHKSETIVILLEVWIEHHHLREALRQELVVQSRREGIQNVMQKSLVLPLEH